MQKLENEQVKKDEVEQSFHVQGMTCHSCASLVEMSWKDVSGIKSVRADVGTGQVSIIADRELDKAELQQALTGDKYQVHDHGADKALTGEETRPGWMELIWLFLLAIGLAWLISRLSHLASTGVQEGMGLGTAVIFGVLASVSSCLAVMSGLLISTTAPFVRKSDTLINRAVPTLMFLTGRFVSYVLLGGFLGWLGSRLSISPNATALILVTAAFYMVAMGLDMLHILPPHWRRFLPGTPKSLTHGVMRQAKRTGIWLPAAVGAATFFFPCGFTQALQAYALTTRSFAQSALLLGAFALGTFPGLLAYGLLASGFKGRIGKTAAKLAGALVVVLGLLSIRSAVVLAGWDLPNGQWNVVPEKPLAAMDRVRSTQVIRMKITNDEYIPNSFKLHVGTPVRWEIDNQATGCGRALVVNALGINQLLDPGANVIEFTPHKAGLIRITCSMGLYDGKFEVIE